MLIYQRVVSICFFSTDTYIQAIAYLNTIHQLPMTDIFPAFYPYIEPMYYVYRSRSYITRSYI